jgi:hypothetical protein
MRGASGGSRGILGQNGSFEGFHIYLLHGLGVFSFVRHGDKELARCLMVVVYRGRNSLARLANK